MSYVKNSEHAEALTRAAANAIHKDVTGWEWKLGSLWHESFGHMDTRQRFAPLDVPADAYLVEHLLMVEVKYSVGASTTMINMHEHAHGCSACATIYANDDALKIRMETAVRLAALVAAVMENGDGT